MGQESAFGSIVRLQAMAVVSLKAQLGKDLLPSLLTRLSTGLSSFWVVGLSAKFPVWRWPEAVPSSLPCGTPQCGKLAASKPARLSLRDRKKLWSYVTSP